MRSSGSDAKKSFKITAKKYLISVSIGLVASVALLLIGSALIVNGVVGENAATGLALTGLMTGALTGGFCAARMLRVKQLVTGATAGIVFFLFLALLGNIIYLRALPQDRVGIIFLGVLLFSCLGAMLHAWISGSRVKRHLHR